MNYRLVRAVVVGCMVLCAGPRANAHRDRPPRTQGTRSASSRTNVAATRRALQRALYGVDA